MDAHFASAGGFELDDASRSGGRYRCDEFYKLWLTASLAPTTTGSHQEPFQLTGVEVQLLRGPIHALSASDVNG
jgi:hypothetical protein